MKQDELNHAVARATGEDLQEIDRIGFTLADPTDVKFDPEPCDLPPSILDWDELDAKRHTSLVPALA